MVEDNDDGEEPDVRLGTRVVGKARGVMSPRNQGALSVLLAGVSEVELIYWRKHLVQPGIPH